MSALEEAKRSWQELEYGMLLHFGVSTFARSQWRSSDFPLEKFRPGELDCHQWISVISEAGMSYAVLTVKHHDGFCLWPTEFTDYNVAKTAFARDIVGEFVEACRTVGIRPGIQYSLLDRHCPFYGDDAAYAQFVRQQITELWQIYGPFVEIRFDGAWDKDFPTRSRDYDPELDGPVDPQAQGGVRWQWRELYELVHEIQPDCLLAQTTSPHRPGEINYLPVDLRTAEHFDYIHREQMARVRESSTFQDESGNPVELPIEFCSPLCPDWFWTGRSYAHPGARTIASWYKRARLFQGNLLIGAGPDPRGLLPEYHREILRAARQMMGKA